MAELRVFISSTCYDLSLLRSQLRSFTKNMGYEPIMSDYEDILYDPRNHTHTSCVDEVKNCDVLVLIIGARFGGKASSESLSRINFDMLQNESISTDILKEKDNLSVTQLEVLTAIENSIPIYTFIEKRVWHDHALYEKNKFSDIIDKIQFPSIEKQDTAKYIFKFINFIRLRTKNNDIFTFEKGQDIEEILKKQWSNYFQRLLREQRYAESEHKRLDILSERFEDLKTAILSSINDGDQRETARGIVKYRRLFDFLLSLKTLDLEYIKSSTDSWDTILEKATIKQIIDASSWTKAESDYSRPIRARSILLLNDGTFYESRFSIEMLNDLSIDWTAYTTMKEGTRRIIAETLSEISRPFSVLFYTRKPIAEIYPQYCQADSAVNTELTAPTETKDATDSVE